MRNVIAVAGLMLAVLLSGLELLRPPKTAVLAQTGSSMLVFEYPGNREADFSAIHTMPQGMVISDEFMVISDEFMVISDESMASSAGILSCQANDSIGKYTDILCEGPTTTPVKVVDTSQPENFVTPVSTAQPTAMTTAQPTAVPTVPPPQLACTRFNFDLGLNHNTGSLVPGLYAMREVGTGNTLATWWAAPAWEDSGWITDIHITFSSVWVEVFFYPYGGEPAVNMTIINPANGTAYGWLAGGMCHAIEIEFPLGWAP